MSENELKQILSASAAGDLYSVLGVAERRAATEADLKKAYKKRSLQWHPDKREDGEEAFRAIQEAWEILQDPEKRRQVDSELPFDDSVPGEEDVATDAEFFAIFGGVFARNAMWHRSGTGAVPVLGDEETPLKQVHEFYRWWSHDFDSWRQFVHKEQHDLAEADDRYERRWMLKENARLQKEMRREEHARILRLIATARKLDPRLRAEREERRLAKEREREEREREKREQQEQEEEERRRQERERQAEEKARRKAERREEKRRQRIAAAFRQRCLDEEVPLVQLELLCISLDVERKEELAEATKADLVAEAEEIVRRRAEAKRELRLQREAEEAERERRQRELEAEPEWTVHELGVLAATLNAIPGGVADRWNKVMQELQRADRAWGRSLASVQRKAITLKKGFSAPKPSKGSRRKLKPWTAADQRLLEDAIRQHGKGDWDTVAAAVAGRSADECAARYAELAQEIRKRKERSAKERAPHWDKEHQKQLEKAMRATGKDVSGRYDWKVVAQAVDKYSEYDCEARFDYLRAQRRKK